MNLKHKLWSVIAILLSFLITLTGCRNQVVEKVGVLPDRSTELIVHNTENEETEVKANHGMYIMRTKFSFTPLK